MKKAFLALVVGTSLALVGCSDDPKKKTDEANQHMGVAMDLANQGISEANKAYADEFTKGIVESDKSKWSDEELQGLKKRFLSAKGKLLMSHSYFEKALDLAKDNKDSKSAKDSWINNMYKIKEAISDIDKELKVIEAAISAKQQSQQSVKIRGRSRTA